MRALLFRFGFVYLLLYCWPERGRVGLIPALPFLYWPIHQLCPLVATHLFGLSGPRTRYHPTGSGDTTLDYVQVFCYLVLALIGALIWYALDRRRKHDLQLYALLRVYVRYTLAFTLFVYGFVKVFPLQFSQPSLGTLFETYGESTPMHLLWTFIGASPAYTLFSGLAEVIPGILLCFRRTAPLGALLAIPVMANVFVLNMSYDVPVKLYSFHILVMALFLLLPDLKALYNFFVLREPAQLHGSLLPPVERRGVRIAARVLQAVVVVAILGQTSVGSYREWLSRNDDADTTLNGTWLVDRASGVDGWQRWIVSGIDAVLVAGDQRYIFWLNTDEDKGTVKWNGFRNNAHKGDFHFMQPDRDHLRFEGIWDKLPAKIELHRVTLSTTTLQKRGFHWINEDPYNF